MLADVPKSRHIWSFSALLLLLEGLFGDKHCNNVLPGIQKIVRGVDLSKVDIFDVNEPGYCRNVIELTCNEGKKYINPRDNLEYDMPDQITSFVTATGGFLETTAHAWTSRKDARKSLGMHLDVGLELRKGNKTIAMSNSFSFLFASETLSGNKHRIIDIQASVTSFQATFAPGVLLGLQGDVGYMWRYLPDDIHSEPEPYFDFIRDYGTHYFVQGKFGGTIRTLFTVDEEMFEEKDIDEVKFDAGVNFMNMIKARLGFNYGNEEHSSKFQMHSKNRTDYFGGDLNTASNDFSNWEPTVARQPWVLGGRLLPIYTMAGNSVKAKNMKLAVDCYLNTGYLHELERMVYVADTQWREDKGMVPVDRAVMQRWKYALGEEKEKLMPNMHRVMELRAHIEHQLVPPDWWDAVSFCFKFDSELDEYYIDAPSTSPSCALVDSYSRYLDQKNFRKNMLSTFKLTTGIFAPVADDWFYQLQWCMEQDLQGGSIAESCEGVNAFIHGGLSRYNLEHNTRWRIKIPQNIHNQVPQWFKNVKFCMKFHVEREGKISGCQTTDKRLISEDQVTCTPIEQWSKWVMAQNPVFFDDWYPCVRSWALMSPRL